MLFKEKVYGRGTHNGQRPITIAHLEGSGELETRGVISAKKKQKQKSIQTEYI